MCDDCAEKHGVEYDHAVYVSGPDDGFYCNACDRMLTLTGIDALHIAYRSVRALRIEIKEFGKKLKPRQEAAEQAVQKLLKK